MGMSVGGGGEGSVMAEINVTPLVDVMLVLLIIFLITVPVVAQTIALELPKERNTPAQIRPEHVVISVDRDGAVHWGQERLDGVEALLPRLRAAAARQPQPEVHIRGDSEVRYEGVGRVVVAAQRAGIQKVGFITEPPAGSGSRM